MWLGVPDKGYVGPGVGGPVLAVVEGGLGVGGPGIAEISVVLVWLGVPDKGYVGTGVVGPQIAEEGVGLGVGGPVLAVVEGGLGVDTEVLQQLVATE